MNESRDLVDLALERLLAITWETNWERQESAYALLKEYFRRIFLWHDALNPTLHSEERWSYHVYDLSSAIAPMPDFVREKIDTVWMAHLEARRRESRIQQPVEMNMSRNERRRSHGPRILSEGYDGVGSQAEKDVEKYLHWCGVLDLPQVHGVNLPCPYEPVIRLYERGGNYYRHHGWWQVLMTSFPGPQRADWYKNCSALLALDDASLDKIDSVKLQEATAT